MTELMNSCGKSLYLFFTYAKCAEKRDTCVCVRNMVIFYSSISKRVIRGLLPYCSSVDVTAEIIFGIIQNKIRLRGVGVNPSLASD
jgi:hypothetical protein